jgi:tetratricopeptide (TPR) repeat protein
MLARTCLADIWKHRANALRHLGKYPQSVDAASIAEAFYDSLLTGTFYAAQARYTRAVTLFKMTEYADALSDLRSASETLKTFGDSVPLAKTLILEGVIRFEQGERETGAVLWRDAALLLEKLGGGIDLARVHANLAEYELSKGNLDDAERRALAAGAEFRSLEMDAEIIRARWTLATIALARGDSAFGLRQLHEVAEEFSARNMSADAAFVKLDITEELVRRHLWEPAKEIAVDLACFFGSAGVTLASVAAIQHLRTAVENEQSSPGLVRYVRDFVAADDVARPFSPPPTEDVTN